jgi:hypothetical protein
LEVTEARVLLAEICLLKEKGLTVEAVVAVFVFKNIQPMKDRAYPAYLYSDINDGTRVTNKRIPTTDLLSRLDMILRGRVSNTGAPIAYSAWNLPSHRSFFEFVSNPPARDGSLGLRVWPSPEDIEALIAPLWSLPEGEKQTHFDMSASTDGEEIDAMLNLLAGESSDSTHAEPMAITDGQELVGMERIQKPEEVRPKRPRWLSWPTAPVEEKRKKRRLWWLLSLHNGAGPSAPVCDEVPAEVLPEVAPNGCVHAEVDPNGCDRPVVDPNGCDRPVVDPNGSDRAPAVVHIFDEDEEEEEEEEVPLIRKNSRHYRGRKGIVIFLLQLCQLLLAFRNYQYQILIKPLRRSSLRICYRSRLLMTWWLFVRKFQTWDWRCSEQCLVHHRLWKAVFNAKTLVRVTRSPWRLRRRPQP